MCHMRWLVTLYLRLRCYISYCLLPDPVARYQSCYPLLPIFYLTNRDRSFTDGVPMTFVVFPCAIYIGM